MLLLEKARNVLRKSPILVYIYRYFQTQLARRGYFVSSKFDASSYYCKPLVHPLRFSIRPELSAAPHVNIVLPTLLLSGMSGGPNTIMNLGGRLAANGVNVRFISTDMGVDSNRAGLLAHIQNLSGAPQASLQNISFLDGHIRGRELHIGAADIFVATAWWTAQIIKQILPQMQLKKFIYLIQDFECGLYPYSTDYALALETYDLDYYPIVNHRFLYDHMIDQDFAPFKQIRSQAKSGHILDPAVDKKSFYYSPKQNANNHTLLFYARPNSALRNMFEIGLSALRIACHEGIFDKSWRFLAVGEKIVPRALGKGLLLDVEPWKGFDEYARMVRESDIFLSLMLSPHPSYPPMEAAASGSLAVTNTFSTKTAARLARISGNIISVAPTVEGVTSGLAKAREAMKFPQKLEQNSRISMPISWDDAFKPVLPPLLRFIRRQTQ